MKLSRRLKLGVQLLVLLLSLSIFVPQLVWASAYGSGVYGGCPYQESCAQSTVSNKSFFSKYEWAIFATVILVLILLLVGVLIHRRKKAAYKDNSPPPPPPIVQP